MSLKRIFTKVTGIVMAAAVVVSAFAPMTVKASDEGIFIYSYEHNKTELDQIAAEGFIIDLANPNNQWIDTEDDMKHFLGLVPEFNGYTETYDRMGTMTGYSPFSRTTVFSIYKPFTNNDYVVDGFDNIWVPEGLKFHAANILNYEGQGYITRTDLQNATYRSYNISTLLNQEGKVINYFEKGTNYIVNFVPVLYDEYAYGLILKNLIVVQVMSLEEARSTGVTNNESLTKEMVDQYIAYENAQ